MPSVELITSGNGDSASYTFFGFGAPTYFDGSMLEFIKDLDSIFCTLQTSSFDWTLTEYVINQWGMSGFPEDATILSYEIKFKNTMNGGTSENIELYAKLGKSSDVLVGIEEDWTALSSLHSFTPNGSPADFTITIPVTIAESAQIVAGINGSTFALYF